MVGEVTGVQAAFAREFEHGDEGGDTLGEGHDGAVDHVAEIGGVFEGLFVAGVGAGEGGVADVGLEAEVVTDAEEVEDFGDEFGVFADG